MLRNSTPETTSTPTDTTLAPGAVAAIEAPTAEAALAAVHERFGADATVVEARQVLRGGVSGFFAKERVQLHVVPGRTTPRSAVRGSTRAGADPAAFPAPAAQSAPPSVDDRLDGPAPSTAGGTPDAEAVTAMRRLLGEASELTDEVDFATFLRRNLAAGDGDRPATAPADATTQPATPAASPGAASATSPSADRLRASELWAAAADPTSGCASDVVDQPAPVAAVDRDDAPRTVPRPAPWLSSETPSIVTGQPAGTDAASVVAPEDVAAARSEAASAAPEPGPSDPGSGGTEHPDVPAAASSALTDDDPAWSETALLHLGFPVGLVHGLELDGEDDLAWTRAVAEAVRPLCRPMPGGDAVLVGQAAPALGEALDLPTARSKAWLDAIGGASWTHLVVGDDPWRGDLATGPLAVSWTRAEHLPDALRCAAELGLVLGFGPLDGAIKRARPLSVALAVRRLVGAR